MATIVRAFVSLTALAAIAAYGCSHTSEPTVAPGVVASPPDAQVTSAYDAASATDFTYPGCQDPTDADIATWARPAPDGGVTPWIPTWHPPATRGKGACSDAQVEAILSCLLDPAADAAACKAVIADTNNKSCATCVSPSQSTAKDFGPLLQGDGTIDINFAGCVAVLEPDLTDQGCGANLQALDECTDLACGCLHPIPSDITKCRTDAANGVCKGFQTAAKCVDDLVKAGAPAAACDLTGATLFENALKYGKLFCAGASAPTDGGTDAPVDQ